MSTSTLEQVDWATCMDDTPACQHGSSTGENATHVVRVVCGCHALMCAAHADCAVGVIAQALLVYRGIICATCRTEIPARFVSDVLTVVPL